MIGKQRLAALLVTAAILAPVAPAHGQSTAADAVTPTRRTPIRDELSADARQAWNAAMELYEAGDYQGARVEFMRAFQLSRNPRVLFNVGVCDKNLRRYAQALSVWRRQLDEGGDALHPEDIEQTRAAIAAVEQFVSSIRVTANVEGATLYVDSEAVGTTPFLGPIAIDIGRHTIRLSKSGYQDQVLEVTVSGDSGSAAAFKLEPTLRTAPVQLTVPDVPGVTIFIDGIDMGPAPFKGEVPVGRHTFEARAPGYVTGRQTSEVVYQQPLNMTLTLARERHVGKVRITASEPDALILIDGKAVGSGTWEGVLPSGGHQLTVRKDGFVTYSSDIALSDDQVRTMTVPLRREERGSAWIWWTAGTVAVLAGGAVASYYIFRPTEQAPVSGTWNPGLVPTQW